MNEKKLRRLQNKTQKMEALLRLAQHEESDTGCTPPLSPPSAPQSDHERMIRQLEDQMGTTTRKRKQIHSNPDLPCNQIPSNPDLPYNDEPVQSEERSDIHSAYRKLVKKRKREVKVTQLVQIYIDQHFLSSRRRRNLLYDDEAAAVTSPLALHVSHIQQFIMYSVFGRNSLYRPKWCSIQFVTSVTQVMVLCVEGVSWVDVSISLPSSWPHTHHLFTVDHSIRIVSPALYGGDLEEDLFMVPLPPSEVSNHQSQPSSKQSAESDISSAETTDDDLALDIEALTRAKDVCSRTTLLLSFTDLVAEGYPIPCHPASYDSENGLEGFKFSKEGYCKVAGTSPLYAVDCEMVLTNDQRSSLASVCVVDEDLNTVYKTLVKPDRPIKNYLTRFSGITADILEGVTTTVRDVQKALRELLPPDAVLCGQSLNCDLVALKLFHPYVIDTSVCYNLKGMPHSKTGLKRLAHHFLKKDIQGGCSGHCPEEDARTTMELVLLKLKLGYSFGNVLADGLTATPMKFFKKLPKFNDAECDSTEKVSSLSTNSLATCSSNIKGSKENDISTSAKPLNNGVEAYTHEPIKTVSAAPRSLVEDCADTSLLSNMSQLSQTRTDPGDSLIPPLLAFSRRNIPQIEVNMFDLVGHQDGNKAEICAQCLSMREPQNKHSVIVTRCDKNRHVVKKAKKALKCGTNLVYSSIASARDSKISSIKKHASSTDEYVSDLWDCLLPGGLFCLVLSGTTHNHGSLMFGVKHHGMSSSIDTEANTAPEFRDAVGDDDVYAMMYNCK